VTTRANGECPGTGLWRSFDLPVAAALPGLREARWASAVPLCWPPTGIGETTFVPLVVAEPDRLAARVAVRPGR
jgi:hypothetical protein